MERLEQLKRSEWYMNLPAPVKQAVDQMPPTQLYNMDGDEVRIIGYNQNADYPKEITLTVEKTGFGGFFKELGAPELDHVRVTNIELDDLQRNVD